MSWSVGDDFPPDLWALELSESTALLASVLDIAKSDQGRRSLVQHGVVHSTATATAHWIQQQDTVDPTMSGLRILRNLCSLGSTVQTEIASTKVIPATIRAVLTLADCDSEPLLRLLRTALQFLCNVCANHTDNQQVVWSACFIDVFHALIDVKDAKLFALTCALVHQCTCQSNERARLLADSEEGWTLLLKIIVSDQHDHGQQQHAALEWIVLLIQSAVIGSGCLGNVVENFPGGRFRMTREKLALLEIFETLTDDADRLGACGSAWSESALWLVRYLRDIDQMLVVKRFAKTDGGHVDSDAQIELESLFCILQILGNATAVFKNGEFLSRVGGGGLIKFVLDLLAMMDSIDVHETAVYGTETVADLPKKKIVAKSPFSIKRALIRLIANLTFEHRANQDLIGELGGVEAVLSHCRIDDNNPYMQQWSIFALHNLTQGHPENQAIIEKLKLEGLRHPDEAAKLGVRFDAQTGKVKISRPKKS